MSYVQWEVVPSTRRRDDLNRPIFTKTAKIVPFITLKADLRYLNPLRNASMLNKGDFANFAQNRLPWQRP